MCLAIVAITAKFIAIQISGILKNVRHRNRATRNNETDY
jgi:hypothetical protein